MEEGDQMRKQQFRMEIGGAVARIKAGKNDAGGRETGSITGRNATNEGAMINDAQGDDASFTFCCPYSQWFWQRPGCAMSISSGDELAPAAIAGSIAVWAIIGQA